MKFREVNHTNATQASHRIDKHTCTLNVINKETYGVEMAKARQVLDLSHHIGFFVYNYAKLCMLELSHF